MFKLKFQSSPQAPNGWTESLKRNSNAKKNMEIEFLNNFYLRKFLTSNSIYVRKSSVCICLLCSNNHWCERVKFYNYHLLSLFTYSTFYNRCNLISLFLGLEKWNTITNRFVEITFCITSSLYGDFQFKT